ncbi:TrgA family protein [Stagnihabitans tardus]|uniref:TrgA family protein n=1 Tax=Stagnihabitans tardus TaxID=2699202 RepID=A0AAE4YCR0_9RHOB|nr:TrgA family protein [Stagnihabitans tardus]NBZ87854.1 TrgA family protein [Stagnihabitans tardus]
MPTFAKLTAAVLFAFVGWWAAVTYNAHLPDNVSLPKLPYSMAALGAALGWWSLGPSSGKGYRDTIAYGLRTSVLIGFLAMFGVAFLLMLRKSTNQMYRADPFAAVLDVPDLMYQYGRYMLNQDVLMVLAAGGIIGGILVEYAARNWK